MWCASARNFSLAAFLVVATSNAPLVSGSGLAQAADYETLMKEGVKLRRTGEDTRALKMFEQAYDLNKTPRALGQIGMAEQALGRWVPAEKHLRQTLASKDDAWVMKNRAALESALGAVAAHVGQLDVTGTPSGAEVRVDGELVGQLPLEHPIAVTAGGVALEVRAEGYLPIVRSAVVAPRTLTREIFNLQAAMPAGARATTSAGEPTAIARPVERPAEATPVTPTTPPPDGSAKTASTSGSSRLPFVLGAAGLSAASLAFGIVEHLSWQNKVSTFGSMSGCGTMFADYGGAGCKDLYDAGQSARTLSFVGYGLAGAFAVTAVVLQLTAPSSAPEQTKVACAPLSSEMTGLACSGQF